VASWTVKVTPWIHCGQIEEHWAETVPQILQARRTGLFLQMNVVRGMWKSIFQTSVDVFHLIFSGLWLWKLLHFWDVMTCILSLRMFWSNVRLPVPVLKMEAVLSFKTTTNICRNALRHLPEDSNHPGVDHILKRVFCSLKYIILLRVRLTKINVCFCNGRTNTISSCTR
jgi:hypothetical protein